jgi:mono/diheme cytochrome c family protein
MFRPGNAFKSPMSRSSVIPYLLAVTLAATPPAAAQRARSSVWSGVYTGTQAERGKSAYVKHCARCHGEDVATSQNPLSGQPFMDHWEERTLAELFRRIRDTMPRGEPATVADVDKIDAMAYVLQQNGFPAGDTELTADADALAAIQIVQKTGPGPLKSGTLVRVVGCLTQRDEHDWQLTSASEPERTSLDPASPSGREPSSKGGGTRTIALMNPFPSPAAHVGHRMMATGFLIRSVDGDAVNVVSLDMLAPECR